MAGFLLLIFLVLGIFLFITWLLTAVYLRRIYMRLGYNHPWFSFLPIFFANYIQFKLIFDAVKLDDINKERYVKTRRRISLVAAMLFTLLFGVSGSHQVQYNSQNTTTVTTELEDGTVIDEEGEVIDEDINDEMTDNNPAFTPQPTQVSTYFNSSSLVSAVMSYLILVSLAKVIPIPNRRDNIWITGLIDSLLSFVTLGIYYIYILRKYSYEGVLKKRMTDDGEYDEFL